ncbi:hypothetical protein DFJ43DRAFT_994490 [Lentinula guzmanii]|uniref:CxC1-like cysteine cluster associated with KDZ transposases domain-containing protein n=1 Tax=Lentinula guzmanii TaxID=2804957 RepID=A0AA38JIU3_9AGAR|nr:hypothetical protein DFJ43DRAFT_994490 [Lentinula guzmanii]
MRKAHLAKTPPATPSRSDYNAFPSSPCSKSPSKRRAQPILYGVNGSVLSQRKLPTPIGQFGFLERPQTDIGTSPSVPLEPNTDSLASSEIVSPSAPPTAHRQKRLAQTLRWQNDVLPTLIAPYMNYLRQSANLSKEVEVEAVPCTCMDAGQRVLDVVVVRFNKLQKLQLTICHCHPAAVQLIERGLFGSAPKEPTLAVDLHVLDFITRLFLRISPNNTAICNTIEDFLSSQGYQLRGKDPLRRRFSMALRWYNALQQATTSFVDSILDISRQELLEGAKPNLTLTSLLPGTSQPIEDRTGEHNHDRPSKRTRTEGVDPASLGRPSDYLRSRCPVCFGGKSEFTEGVIVCIDACFTQKHNKQPRDPKHTHPKSVFVSPEEVDTWRDFVEEIRPRRSSPAKHTPETEEDGFEGMMKVPKSVLDICQDSFTAADGNREKASTQFFDSTALMALLCRHDRVLWLADMTTPGERQHYVFALISKLFEELPSHYTVGILYDIACAVERSCVNWGFLDEYLPRITFAISVFHAFGHGWACQCVYHPRKCIGFGLSDGEGCERFWHSISKLIAYLRVCGHHIRLYTLDSQIQHADSESLAGFGTWLARKWKHAKTKWEGGQKDVLWSMWEPQVLREQWESQKHAATRPLPRKSRSAAKTAIEEALRLRKARDTLRDSIKNLENIIIDGASEPYEIAEAEMELPNLRERLDKVHKHLVSKERALGVEGKSQYNHLASSPFITDRMNARALKVRLRQRLQARKFERDRLERTFRRQLNKRKLHNHTEDSVKRRNHGIQSLAQQYNKLCEQMVNRISLGRAPANAIAPRPIPTKELFSLDVDDSIWDDIGLDDSEQTTDLPLWLVDEGVRMGIQGILLRDRCDEELQRLRYELKSLAEWHSEEWTIVNMAIATIQDSSILYALYQQRRNLARLAVQWTQALAGLPSEVVPCFAVPEGEELIDVQREVDAELIEDEDEMDQTGHDEELVGYNEFEDDDLDIGLVEYMDTLALTDAGNIDREVESVTLL